MGDAVPRVGQIGGAFAILPDRGGIGLAGVEEIEGQRQRARGRSEEHTSELQSLMRISYAVFCLKKKKTKTDKRKHDDTLTNAKENIGMRQTKHREEEQDNKRPN